MQFKATKNSVSQHEVPEWFHDAKLGIFIHWGLYSVPAFAVVTEKNFAEIVETEGPDAQFKANPYAEWYLNSLRIEGTETVRYHRETYGLDFSYDDFKDDFNKQVEQWDPAEMARLFKDAGAKYVVLVTKHHDGFLMWPSKHENPNKETYHASRDVVGELSTAVRKQDMRMGLYYSGLLDWSFNPEPITNTASLINSGTNTGEYIDYANNHWIELIENYAPAILWNDIGYPTGTNIYEIFAHYYNKHPDGVINDRWIQYPKWMKKAMKVGFICKLVNWIIKQYIKKKGASMPTPGFHHDFVTPEYASFNKIREKKWECTRGIGNSFGYNIQEKEEDYLSVEELVHLLVDIVSKNGNLLLNVGPMANGKIPDVQKNVLIGLGHWLKVNGEAIHGTRPWLRAEGQTKEGIPVRFTQKEEVIYAILLGTPNGDMITIRNVKEMRDMQLELLGYPGTMETHYNSDDLVISLNEPARNTPALAMKFS